MENKRKKRVRKNRKQLEKKEIPFSPNVSKNHLDEEKACSYDMEDLEIRFVQGKITPEETLVVLKELSDEDLYILNVAAEAYQSFKPVSIEVEDKEENVIKKSRNPRRRPTENNPLARQQLILLRQAGIRVPYAIKRLLMQGIPLKYEDFIFLSKKQKENNKDMEKEIMQIENPNNSI